MSTRDHKVSARLSKQEFEDLAYIQKMTETRQSGAIRYAITQTADSLRAGGSC